MRLKAFDIGNGLYGAGKAEEPLFRGVDQACTFYKIIDTER